MLLPRINCSFLQASDEILAPRRWSVLKSDIGWFTSCPKSNWSSPRTLENLVFHWYERGNFSLEKSSFLRKRKKISTPRCFHDSCFWVVWHGQITQLLLVYHQYYHQLWSHLDYLGKKTQTWSLRKLLLLNRKTKNFQSLNKTSAASQRLFTFALYLVVQQTQEECIGEVGTLSVYN